MKTPSEINNFRRNKDHLKSLVEKPLGPKCARTIISICDDMTSSSPNFNQMQISTLAALKAWAAKRDTIRTDATNGLELYFENGGGELLYPFNSR